MDRRAHCPWVGDIKDNTWSIGEEKKWPWMVFQDKKLKQEGISRRLCLYRTWVHLKEMVWKPFCAMRDRERKRKEIATGTDNKIYTSWESALIKGNISAWKKMKHEMLNLRQGSFNRTLTAEVNNYRDYQTSGGTEGSSRGQEAGTSS